MTDASEPMAASLLADLKQRFGDSHELDAERLKALGTPLERLSGMLGRASCRSFRADPVPQDLLRLLCATALSAPSKSDLQQADIIQIADPAKRAFIAERIPSMPWVGEAPAFLVICANNRRQRQVARMRRHAFANDHLDAFFNASVDAAIVLATLVTAVEAVGLGCCPVSVLRNFSAELAELLALPEHVFALAGLAIGWPEQHPEISPRLGLEVTLHRDRFSEDVERLAAYDTRRREQQPYARQRRVDQFGEVADYGWSEDKARQYALPERQDFGEFIKGRGFRLD